ncbi:hypothetical protein ACQ4LE_007916 [Meloidogyne hapla]|uniref:MIF4G domain-containing protein n=1 Tax=Meloidogyne hapla TaxID=6305 RepID=A0A1I8BRI7_MELHA
MDKQHSNYCPPSTTFGSISGSSEFSEANTYHQRHLEQQPFQSGSFVNYNTQNSMGLIAETSANTISQQNGHFQGGCIPGADTSLPPLSQPYQDASPIKPNFPPSFISSTTGFPPLNASPQSSKSYNPFGYKNRSSTYNVQQQQNTQNFVSGCNRQPPTSNYILNDQQISSALNRQSAAFIGGSASGAFSTSPLTTPNTNATINSGAIAGTVVNSGGRPSPQLPLNHPSHSQQQSSFLSMASGPQQIHPQLTQQQQAPFHQIGNNNGVNYQSKQYGSAVGGTNAFDMSPLLYDTGIDNNTRHTGPAMNGAMNEEFLGEFVPAELQQEMSARYVLSNELLERIEGSPKKQALFEFQIGLEQIAFDVPTNFNTWATVIKDRMIGRDPLPEPDLRIASEILIEMAVVLDESQYNYSCLCQFLDKHIENFSQNILLSQLTLFINDTHSSLSLQHYCNLVTFLAELYDKIEVKGVKSSQLAAHLFDQLHGLLKFPSDNQGIGVIVKVLKLTGRFLENDRGSEAMNTFMMDLDECSALCNDLTKLKVQNLLELRAKHWGIVAETARAGDNDTCPIVGLLGPDGEQLIPDDDCAFLDENFDTLGNSPSGSLYNNPIEEDNVEDDYEKFLQATAERTAERALVSFDDDDESIVSSPPFMSKQGNERMS